MPLRIDSLNIETPMLKDLHNQISLWVSCGYIGGLISGKARLGKSVSINAIGDCIRDYSQNEIPTRLVKIGNRDKKTIRGAFYAVDTAKSINIQVKRGETADKICDHLVEYFLDLTMQSVTRQAVLFIDEAQFLDINQFNIFAELQNQLIEFDVNICIFFIVNKDQFKNHVDSLLLPEYEYLRERFFNYNYSFNGIANENELRECLKCYDEPREELDNQSVTYFFCPQSEEYNFMLASISKLLWTLWVENYAKPYKYKSWGMTYFIRTLTVLLEHYFPKYWSMEDEDLEAICMKSLNAAGNAPTISPFSEND